MRRHDALQAARQRHERNATVLILVVREINELAREDSVFRAVVQHVLAVTHCRRSICEDCRYTNRPRCLALEHIVNGILVVCVLFKPDSAVIERHREVADATQEGPHHIPQLLLDGQQITLPIAGPHLHAKTCPRQPPPMWSWAHRPQDEKNNTDLVGDDVQRAQNYALPIPAAIRKAGAGALPHYIVNHRFALPTQSVLQRQDFPAAIQDAMEAA